MLTIDLKISTLKAAAYIAWKDDVRPYLNGVLVDVMPRAVRLVATDGHRLVCFHSEVACEEDMKPAQIIIPLATLKGLKARNRHRVMLALRFNPEHPEQPCTLIGCAGGDKTFTPIDGKFPDYSRAMPLDKPDGTQATFNGQYLADMDTVCRIALDMKAATFAHVYPNGERPASVLHHALPGFYGVLMPRRNVASDWALPAWLAPKA